MNDSRLGLPAMGCGARRLALALLLGLPLVRPALCEPRAEESRAVAEPGEAQETASWREATQSLTGDTRPAARRPAAIDPARLAAELGGKDRHEARATFGTRLENGLELALSATHVADDPSLAFSYSLPRGIDALTGAFGYERSTKIHGKAGFGPFRLTASHSERDTGMLGTQFGAFFADPTNSSLDKNTLLDFTHSMQVRQFGVTTRVFHGSYAFRGNQLYPAELYVDTAQSQWLGGEAKAVGNVLSRHKVTLAADYQRSEREANQAGGGDPFALSETRRAEAIGFSVGDDYSWNPKVTFAGGLRYDYATTEASAYVSPRVGVTYKAASHTTARLQYQHTVRNPAVYGSSYSFLALRTGSADLRSERVRSAEFALEYRPAANMKLTSTLFSNSTDSAIRQVTDWISGVALLRNEADFESRGAQVAFEGRALSNTTLYASYTIQVVDAPAGVAQAPRDIARLTFSGPVLSSGVSAALETQYTGSRQTSVGEVGGLGLANVTLRYRMQNAPVELSASAYNLLDRRYADPIVPDLGALPGDPFEQAGRTLGLKAVLWL